MRSRAKKPLPLKIKRGRIKTDVFDGTINDLYAGYRHFLTLAELAGHITSESPIENILEKILDELNTCTGAERSLILIFDRAGQVVYQKGRNLNHDDIHDPRFEVSWSIITKVREQHISVCIPNAMEDEEFKSAASVLRLHVLSVICVPIIHLDQLIGVFYADNRTVLGLFHENEYNLARQCMQFIANPLSMLLRNLELKQNLQRAQQHIQNRDSYGDIIGNSPALLKVLNLANQVAPTQATVLIYGESGTGKELVARAIHQNSERKDKPFISLNCGALPENLLESALFGHVKGAFTGAHQDKKGWFETADGGTIFFDEISEMSPALQIKLLRILQSGEYTPVGSTVIKQCDVRIIAATNVQLEQLVHSGRFRQDLYYRLNIINLQLPRLAERRDDILLLAQHFLAKYGHPELRLHGEAQNALLSYDFPGNVRELENAMQRVAVLCRGKDVLIEHLPPEMQRKSDKPKTWGTFAAEKQKVVEDFEKAYLQSALKRAKGNVAQAARASGMDAKNFYQKMARYHIQAAVFKNNKG
ncbi:sigma-54-dependent Fis family transcriptional regulator [candidate division KSB1 bacterium]|nr:sigma-54-dependent Fis family transcriptional regulator [candidate division KSB1 bacterium]RQW00379.1 MAG: sigma-54-dependent Fis family transcriptional regulator [candidate division KSB1 bacterium]